MLRSVAISRTAGFPFYSEGAPLKPSRCGDHEPAVLGFPFYSEGAPLKPFPRSFLTSLPKGFPFYSEGAPLKLGSFDTLDDALPRFPFYSEGAPLKRGGRHDERGRRGLFPLLFGRGSIEACCTTAPDVADYGFPLLFGRGSIEAYGQVVSSSSFGLFPLLFGRGSIEAISVVWLFAYTASFPFYSEGAPLKRAADWYHGRAVRRVSPSIRKGLH